MYHTNKLNQPLFNINPLLSAFPLKNLQTGYTGDINAYIATLTPLQKKVAYHILGLRNAPWAILKNKSIALALGCSIKTVTRATNKFLDDNFITKKQPNKYAPNNYTFNDGIKKVKFSFSHWFESLSPVNQDLYSTHGIRVDHKKKIIYSYRNVPHNISSLIFSSLCSKNVVVSSRAHARGRWPIQKTKGQIVNEAQKQLILDNRYDSRVKGMLKTPEIKNHIITPIIQKIAKLLTFDEQEQFKLVAFTDDTLEHVYTDIKKAIDERKELKIHNRMEWVLSFAKAHCRSQNIKPDWPWYYDLCSIVGMNPKTATKSFTISQPKKKDTYKGKSGGWQEIQAISCIEDRVERWRSEVRILEKRLESYGEVDIFNLKGLLIKTIENARQELADTELLLREGENEKQNVLYPNSSRSLEAGCA